VYEFVPNSSAKHWISAFLTAGRVVNPGYSGYDRACVRPAGAIQAVYPVIQHLNSAGQSIDAVDLRDVFSSVARKELAYGSRGDAPRSFSSAALPNAGGKE
jgi:hypothetical protein